jgi:hypothetical protein
MGRRFHRHLDLDLIALIEAGAKRPKRVGANKHKFPRKAETYRGARRNHVLRTLGTTWRGIKPTGAIYRPPVRANRSDNWPPFKGRLYAADAR